MRPPGAHPGGIALKILIATDVFPPRCGGAGWSAYYLARALRAGGHTITVVRPRFDPAVRRAGVRRASYDGFPVAEAVLPGGRGPLAAVVSRNFQAPRLLHRLVAAEARRAGAELIHAQHALTTPAAVAATARLAARGGRHIPVVATVRDYWPLCYYSTMQVPRRGGGASRADYVPADVPVPGCGRVGALARALWQAQGWRGLSRWPLLPAWQAATARRRRALGRADAVIAVSRFVAERLREAGAVDPARLHVVPNLLDLPRLDAALAEPPPWAALGLAPGQPFLLFVGKLEPSKGAQLLPGTLQAAGVDSRLPLVIAGSGPLQPGLAAAGRAAGLDLRFADWLDNDAVLRLMHHATLLLFPSAWEEPLSRVLLEACGAGAPILALATGGTSDILTDGVNGCLVADLPAFTGALRVLLADAALRAHLAAGAHARAEAQFSAPRVAAQVEAVYQGVLATAR